MRRLRWAAAGLLLGLWGLAGCQGPYRPMSYRNGDMSGMDYGMPVTEGPMLGNGDSYPVPPGTMVMPGSGAPSMPSPNPPIMPPASGTPAPPLNTPAPVGPMPRLTPTGTGQSR
jgi:hypothetical protein